jgi:glycosyltransferase involved in cell wall biosynthesis
VLAWYRGYTVKRQRRPVIALVTDAIYPFSFGGRELRYYGLLSRLSAHAELHVYTMNWWQGSRTRNEESATFHAVCRLHPMYAGPQRSIRQALFFALGCMRLLTCRFDVLEADHMPYLHLLVLRLVTGLRRKRLVVTWHEVWGKEYWHEYLGRLGAAGWLMEWLAMRVPDHIIAASAQTADRLQAAAGKQLRITVAPNGIDLDTVREAPVTGEPADIVVVGRLMSHKRIDMLLRAVALLHDAGQPVSCRIIGDGPERAALHERAEQLGVSHAVEFRHDIREQKELYGLMKSARVSAFPSEREGFGIAVLEALACGLPVVTTSAPDNLAQQLVISSGRGIVCESSAQALAEALQQLLAAAVPGAREDQANDPWLDNFGWDATAAAVAGALLA